jgi:hypothetical protein
LLHRIFQNHPTLNWCLWLLCKLLVCTWHYDALQPVEICENWSYLIFLLFLKLQIVGSSDNIDICWNFLNRAYLHQMFLFLDLFLEMMFLWVDPGHLFICLQSCELFVSFTCLSPCSDYRVASFSSLLLNALKLKLGNISFVKHFT